MDAAVHRVGTVLAGSTPMLKVFGNSGLEMSTRRGR